MRDPTESTDHLVSNRAMIFAAAVITIFSWLYMQWTHELGHILAGLATGAQIDRVILDPRGFSQSQFNSNPNPLVTVWGGPLLGSFIGAGIPLISCCLHRSWRTVFLSIAAFVLLANGLYIGLGAVYPVGDAQSLIMFGSPRWLLIGFGVVCVILGRILIQPVRSGKLPRMTRVQTMSYLAMSGVMVVLGLTAYAAP